MPNYDAAAKCYDDRHGDPVSRQRFARIEAEMLQAANAAHTVLEIGVGTGRFLSQVRAPVRIGVDPSPAMLAVAAQHPGLVLHQGSAHALPQDDGSVDVVVAPKGVFRYTRWETAFAEVWRVLVPGGTAFIHQYRVPALPLAERFSFNRAVMRGLEFFYEPTADADTDEAATPVREVDKLAAWEGTARAAGFASVASTLWRPIRFAPYALQVPRALPAWSHVVTRLTKP